MKNCFPQMLKNFFILKRCQLQQLTDSFVETITKLRDRARAVSVFRKWRCWVLGQIGDAGKHIPRGWLKH
jgi:hypothetical protein